MRFRNRREAGAQLSKRLSELVLHDPVVLALPRGGVPVAFVISEEMDAPLDVFVARKIGAPGHREFGIGAIAEGGEIVADGAALQMLHVTGESFKQLAAQERPELERRVRRYRGDRAVPDVRDRDVVLVDDGLATGVTAEAALRALRRGRPRRVILAVPVCAPDTAERLRGIADEVTCVIDPADFVAVGNWYEDFSQTSDEEVIQLLELSRRREEAQP